MDAKLKLTLAGVALAGVLAAVTYVRWDSASAEPVVAAVPKEAPAELTAPPEQEVVEQREVPAGNRAAVTSAPPEPSPAAVCPAPEPTTEPIRGKVLDVERMPLAGVEVEMHIMGTGKPVPGSRVLTEPDGSFTIQPDAHTLGEIVVADDRYTAVLQPTLFGLGRNDFILVVAPRQPVAGTVVDPAGNPVADAKVTIDLHDEFHATFGHVLDHSRIVRWTKTTDEHGRFEIEEAPLTEYGLIVTQAAGFGRDVRDLPVVPTYDLEIMLGVTEDGVNVLAGIVVDVEGRPVEGAYVALEYQNGTTGADGRFAMKLHQPGERGVLMAVVAGMLPARVERTGASNTEPGAWPDPLVLRLGGEPLTIRGRVLDEGGEPLEGLRVWIADTTHFGAVEHKDFGPRMTVAANVESLLRGQEYATGEIETDAAGGFLLKGLMEKDYRISIQDKSSLGFLETEPVPAGTQGLTVRMAAEARHERVAGRVVGLDGEPIPRVNVTLCRAMSPEDGLRDAIETKSMVTDVEGRFVFEDVSTSITHARVHGGELDMDNRPLIPEDADVEALELVVARRCHMRVELSEPTEADQFGLLDEDDGESLLTTFRGNYAWSAQRAPLAEGRSETITASERARTLVLYKEHAEVRRVPLRLTADDVNVVRP